MKKISIIALAPFLLCAQDLSSLVESSLNNQLVKSTTYNVESIKSTLDSVKKGYMPRVTLNAAYQNTNEETVSTPDSSFVTSANISYVVYDGGKKEATYASLESNIKSGNENLSSLKNSLSLQVVSYYFNYHSLLSQKEAIQKEIETLNAQQNRLQKFLEAGTTTSDEVDKIISRVQSANVQLHEIELNMQTILHNLEYLTSSKVTIEGSSTIMAIDNIDEELRSDIKALEHDMEAQLKNARGEKSGDYPTVTVQNSYTYYDLNYDNKAYDSGLDDQNILSLNLSWNLYDFGSRDKAYESAYKQYQGIKSKYEYEKNRANVDLKLALRAYDIAKLKIASAASALKAASSTYEVIEAKYQNGLVDNVAYLEALSEKYSAQSSLKGAKYDLEVKKAQIIYHSGKNIWEYIK